ncbi:RNA polymerase II-associated factor 1, partial [Aphis craccivora]
VVSIMAPTVQNNATQEKRPIRPVEKRSDLVCKVKYCNMLPDIPFDLKFLSYPFDSTRFIQYNPTSLERSYKFEILADHDLGLNIDLVNKDKYTIDYNAQMDIADEKLLEEDILAPQDSKRSRHHARSVSWLRRTEYISTEQTRFQPQTIEKVEAKVGFSIKKNFKDKSYYLKYAPITSCDVERSFSQSSHHARSVSWLRRTEYISTEQTRFQPQTIEKVEAKVGFSIKKNFKEETLYMDRDSQMKAIEKTFEDNKKPVEKHYSKPNVHAVETLNVFPDFKNWRYPCAQVIFDSDPDPMGRPVPAQIEEMSQAMIRGVMDESGEQFVAYFLPSEETIIKRREDAAESRPYDDDYEYEYKMAREYNWNVKSKNSKGYEENYFLIVQPDGVFYNELETRVRLSKRRQKIGTQSSSTNTRLIVRHVPINEQEFSVHKFREKQLQPYDDEEEAKAEEAAKKAMQGDSNKNDSVEESKVKRVSSEARSDSDNSDVEMRSKKSSESGASEVNSDSSISDNSEQESNRGSDTKLKENLNWRYPCAQVIFDSDPAPMGRPVPAQIEEMSQAMIRGVMDESGEQFVAYFLPSEETIIKRREDAAESRPYDDDYEYEYKMAREYNWNVKSKSSKGYEENYFLIVQPDGVFYNELETRVRLSKRRQKIGTQSSSTNTRLIVRHVPINEQEFSVHKFREKQLQPYDEEEEAKAEEAAKKAMQAAKESAKELTTKNKADSDDDDDDEDDNNDNDSRKGDSKKNDSDSDVSDDDEATTNPKRANSETVDSDKEKNKSHRASSEVNSDSDTSIKKPNSHKVSSGSDDSDKSDEEDNIKRKDSSQSGDSEEERKVKRVSSEARSDSDNSDVEMRSKKSSEHGASDVNSDSSVSDNSEQESNRGSDSDE